MSNAPGPGAGNVPATKPSQSVTRRVFHQFVDRFQVPITQEQLVGLCAYLSALLTWGYATDSSDLDRFVVCYAAFESSLPQLYDQAADGRQWPMPAYHTWLEDPNTSGIRARYFDPSKATLDNSILTETVLREIWHENLFHFLWVELSMQRIAKEALDRGTLRP